MADQFADEPVCAFLADGGELVPIVLVTLTEETEYRIIERERPYCNGAKLDTTGRKKSIFTLETAWFDGNEEPDVPQAGYYPDYLDALIDSFDSEVAGTLKLPLRPPLRVRCKSYRRAEKFDERSLAAVSFTFWTDNEDSVTAASFTKNSPTVAVPLIYANFSDAAQLVGLVSADVVDLAGLIAALSNALAIGVGVALAALSVVDTVASIEASFTNQTTDVGVDVGRILSDPESWYAARLLRRLAAQAAAAALLTSSTAPADVTQIVYFKEDVSMFDIAGRMHQEVDKLLTLNPSYDNPFLIPAGSPIRIVTV